MDLTRGCGQNADVTPGTGSPVDRRRFEQILRECVRTSGIDVHAPMLIVGGSYRDAHVAYRAGFRNIVLSNIEPMADADKVPMDDARLTVLHADLERLDMPNGAYELVLAHEVLHHCRSPHQAVLEMLRVSSKHVMLMEPNDSLIMRALVKLRLSFPYELPAVIYNDYAKGGVQNSDIPNYIYRWDRRSLYQTTAAYLPESEFSLNVRQYWDFNVDARELSRRKQTRLGTFTKILGPSGFLFGLKAFQATANAFPWLRRQGNKFFAHISKQEALKPWLVREGEIVQFNRNYGKG